MASTIDSTIPASDVPDAGSRALRHMPLPLEPIGPAPVPALATGDDWLPPGDTEDDDGLLQLAQFAPEGPRPNQPATPPPAGLPRIDDMYRMERLSREQERDLDWLFKVTGGYPQPQAPAAPNAAAPMPGAPAQPDAERGVVGQAADVAATTPWWVANAGVRFPAGVGNIVGGIIQAPDIQSANAEITMQRARRQRLEIADAIDRGESPTGATGGSLLMAAAETDWILNYRGMTPEQRQAERTRIRGEITSNVPMAIAERSLYQAGERVKQVVRDTVPYLEGYDQNSWSSMIGEGLGSVATSIVASLAAGPAASGVLFAGAGMSEATERAVAFDKTEKAAGRPGLTDEQIAFSGLSGVVPGASDAAPVEVLLGRLKIPGMTPAIQSALARAITKTGGAALIQAGVEGLQEGAQQAIQNLIALGYNPEQSLTEDVLKNMGVGAAVGGIAGGAGGVRRSGAGQPAPAPGMSGLGLTSPAEAAVPGGRAQPGQAPPPSPGQQQAPAAQPQQAPIPRTPLQEMLDADPNAPLVIRLSIDTLVVGRVGQ